MVSQTAVRAIDTLLQCHFKTFVGPTKDHKMPWILNGGDGVDGVEFNAPLDTV